MKMSGGVDVQIYVLLNSAQDRGEWSDSRSCRFIRRENSFETHWIGGWVEPRGSLDDMEK
jgi:hypothetical protein